MTATGPVPFWRAPGFLGAFLLAFALPWLASCGRKTGTPEWPDPPAASIPAAPSPAPARPAADAQEQEPVPLRFVAYNLQNWLTMERTGPDGVAPATKPETSKQAAVALLAAARPDVLGVCEIGTRDDLADLQRRLKSAGLDLPHRYFTGGVDPVRHLGLLSRFPIPHGISIKQGLDYQLDGRSFSMQRGILDVTVDMNGQPVRFVGVHLKSKRPVEEGDQEHMRRHEAHLLRRHVESILAADPATRLIVYGDFNDTKASATLKTIQGPANHPGFLAALPLADERGEAWTHAWEAEDLYARYDWILVSPAMKARVDPPACRVLDGPPRRVASDHRPLLAVFR